LQIKPEKKSRRRKFQLQSALRFVRFFVPGLLTRLPESWVIDFSGSFLLGAFGLSLHNDVVELNYYEIVKLLQSI
jgi:hypothetical protein